MVLTNCMIHFSQCVLVSEFGVHVLDLTKRNVTLHFGQT